MKQVEDMKFIFVSEKEKYTHPLTQAYRKIHNDDYIPLHEGADLIYMHKSDEIFGAISFTSDEKPFIELAWIWVNPDIRKKGNGSKLMEFFFKLVRNKKKSVRLYCREKYTGGRALVKKFNFKQIDDDNHFELKFKDFPRFTEKIE